MNTLFDFGFPHSWSTLKKLIWTRALMKQNKTAEPPKEKNDTEGKDGQED